MTGEAEGDPDSGKRAVVPRDDGGGQELISGGDSDFAELVKLERDRIGVQLERNELARRALEISNELDKRQFEFHAKRLDVSNEESKRRLRFSLIVFLVVIGMSCVAVSFLLIMMFFGNEIQSELASRIVEEVFKVVAGGGFFFFLAMFARRLFRR